MRRTLLASLCAGLLALGAGAAPAGAAYPEPDFIYFPDHLEPPLQGPCGLAVGNSGHVYLSNYYPNTFLAYNAGASLGFVTAHFPVDPLDGPCGLDADSSGNLYVNSYHRHVEKFTPSSHPPGMHTGYTSAGIFNSDHPTGVAVDRPAETLYIDNRTYISAYETSGEPVMVGSEPLRIGEASLGDGYGIAVSGYPATRGYLYVPDRANEKVKVYDPSGAEPDEPVAEIEPPGGFGSLRDSAVAVDNASGDVYVADTLAYPQFTHRPQAIIRVFDSTGTYKGRLKYALIDGSPPGLAVDNSGGSNQGRVYATTGNSVQAGVYAYPPGSATSESGPARVSLSVTSSGDGQVLSKPAGISCGSDCEEAFVSHLPVTLSALPQEGARFLGFSGAGCEGEDRTCEVAMSESHSVEARFSRVAAPSSGPAPGSGEKGAGETSPLRSSEPAAHVSEIAGGGRLQVKVSGSLSPTVLPRRGRAPISVSVGGRVMSTEGAETPRLARMAIEINRHGRFSFAGLPTCNHSQIQPGSTAQALRACRSALVGQGRFSAEIVLPGQDPYPTQGRLLVFNAKRGKQPALFGHIYATRPFSTSFVIVFRIQPIPGRGAFGTVLTANLPRALGSWGNITSIDMNLKRLYRHRGKRRSYLSAGCPAPPAFNRVLFPLARASFTFVGGKSVSSVLMRRCRVRGR